MAIHDETIDRIEARNPDRRSGSLAPAADARVVTERILDSAEVVLRRHGYAGFSTRRVAQEASIALGNLTYHFPTKPELVRALINRMVATYLGRFEDSLRMPEGGLESLVRWLLEEPVNEDAMWLFRELWAMALHDEEVREFIDDFYDELMGRVISALLAAYPDAEPQDVSDLVHLVAIMSEGSTVIYGTRRNRASSHQRVKDLAAHLVTSILDK